MLMNIGNKDFKTGEYELLGKDIFDITTTGMPFYDLMLGKGNIVGKYKNDPVGYFIANKGLVFEIEWMSPEEYLEKSYNIHRRAFGDYDAITLDDYLRGSINPDLINEYIERTIEGSKMPIPMLDYSDMCQEGRHRSVVAMELGVEEIPVLVVRSMRNRI